ncbi:enoyl-CoA hydratase/isomerase family protein [Acidiphilium cryptum]|uniref:Enoyl-CoA hydratase/isomerase n=1 Tax=Acidiphilium cryptum (strain JF-5) TaxID=349163 RepID=A5FTU5_ACICJ|nr:enoyl-CoA hydratase/isomerase family protein [Acidiphilium cryptum]ABQ29027.1 Enoyl-CoA hydratase/isomerase [Acidiphilium cryptum JF-5]
MSAFTQESEDLVYEVRGQIGYITFNRPASRNALTFAMYERLAAICGDTGDLRALVLTGGGEKAFAAGTDINQFRAFRTPEDALAYERRIDAVLQALETCPTPTIAAISGACTGGGAAIAAVCDLRIASESAKFGFPIARTLGNCLSAENYARLAALIGAARVKDLIFTARLIGAGEAERIGLVSEVLPDHETLLARASALAETMTRHAPLTLRVTKDALNRISRLSRIEANDLILTCYMSEDFREGMDAFLTKRQPDWKGR